MKFVFLLLIVSQLASASVDYIDVRDTLSKDPKKTVIVIGCKNGTRVLLPVDKNEKNAVKKYKIDVTKFCKEENYE